MKNSGKKKEILSTKTQKMKNGCVLLEVLNCTSNRTLQLLKGITGSGSGQILKGITTGIPGSGSGQILKGITGSGFGQIPKGIPGSGSGQLSPAKKH